MRTSCIILNYNDAVTTIEQIKRVREFSCFEYIVVVDNCSTDDSVKQLSPYVKGKVLLVTSKKNGGYGAGNNLGIHYSFDKLGMTHAVIANPDTVFTESCVKRISALFMKNYRVGVAAATMMDDQDGGQASGWPLMPWICDLLNTGPISRRVFKRVCRYPEDYFVGKNAVYVDVVHGSMLMVDLEKMLVCGGYDESVFLYNEEAILACRMKKQGYKTVQLLSDIYYHKHSVSISKAFKEIEKRQIMRHESALYYYQNYLQVSDIKIKITRAFHQMILWEIWFCKNILKMDW